jgi:hypothetical protein
VVVSQEDDAEELISGCMWTGNAVTSIDPDGTDPEIQPEGGMKIAWRYEKMKQFSTTVPKRSGPGTVDQGSVDSWPYFWMSNLNYSLSGCLTVRICPF